MLLAAALYLTSLQGDPSRQSDDPGIQHPTMLVIYKQHLTPLVTSDTTYSSGTDDPSEVGDNSGHRESGMSISYDRVGLVNWSVNDGGVAGVPCKFYKGDGTWKRSSLTKKEGIHWYEDSYRMAYTIGLDGIPMHSESHFEEVKDSDDEHAKTIDVTADYKEDHIVVTVTKNGIKNTNEVYPSFGMDRFATMFQPLIRSGLVQDQERQCSVIHPYTGLPYDFTLRVRRRFSGDYFSLPQEGYCVDVLGSEGNSVDYVSRQGQLLRLDLPDQMDAGLELGPDYDERKGWGHFRITDWDKSTDDSNPERPKYNTLAVPVLFKNPHILFPVPCVLAE